jgi:hypothetical protein
MAAEVKKDERKGAQISRGGTAVKSEVQWVAAAGVEMGDVFLPGKLLKSGAPQLWRSISPRLLPDVGATLSQQPPTAHPTKPDQLSNSADIA